jgi:hypothetical protein
LPYVLGRVPAGGEERPERDPDLLIEDEKPFRLSRHHFMITRSDDEIVITDLDSALGTIANEHAIGHHFMRHTAPLHRGENRIVAGGRGSPFEFMVSVGHLVEAPRILLKQVRFQSPTPVGWAHHDGPASCRGRRVLWPSLASRRRT